MIDIKLISYSATDPVELASHAALKCYQAENPKWGKLIDVENRLFKVGHHTTLQHSFFTFSIENIAVGDITFGMHLTHPFYNSDQRSGRYCAKMFLEPDFGKIENYIKKFWPEVKVNNRKKIVDYIKRGVKIYHSNVFEASRISEKLLKKERPHVNEKYLEMTAPKIAQEQMRMFIPLIFPTGFDFTINLTALAALYRSSWTPSMRYIIDRMAEEVTKKFPNISFMFDKKERKNFNWQIKIPKSSSVGIKYKPSHRLLRIEGENDFIIPKVEDMHPVDLLHFKPDMMNNATAEFITEIEISGATMGQDQRHRTIRRSEPKFTGSFYMPPILREMKLEKEALSLMKEWISVSKNISGTLAMVIAPYGAMVGYKKAGSMNAIAHEQAKRLCWCAQEEIYHAGRALRLGIEKKKGKKSKLLAMFEPPCYQTGKCAEGGRYCGRDLKIRKTGNYFPERKV
ncbi:MAG TPA: FAD-dependent thymidylate synthase [Candidatus Moranbacteria bacterium]|nr:FAD-dependent thymidylate synthase [Candidatus Moranbacteria bacterium]